MTGRKNIIFDLGGVLLNLDIRRTFEAFRQIGLNNMEELFRIGHASSFFKQYETGEINNEEFISSIEQYSGNKGSRAQIIAAWNAMLLDFPTDRVEWLQRLKSKYRLFLFSNTNAIHLERFQQTFTDEHGFIMDDLFEAAYYSHLVQLRKPDAAAYEFVLMQNNLIPAETFFIDDALVNVEAAIASGINGIHLLPGAQVTELPF